MLGAKIRDLICNDLSYRASTDTKQMSHLPLISWLDVLARHATRVLVAPRRLPFQELRGKICVETVWLRMPLTLERGHVV